ncbi:MAG: tRNA-dihydrouridine synthase [Patescibacteria group bacterium]|nr:tRNA-dihydrouridine synthase [Patescibacteria group bacterium]
MKNFWEKLPRPFFALAPMEDVTDAAFRRLIASYASPSVPRVLYTEFTSADGILKAPESGRRKLLKRLEYAEIERPIVAQLFTAVPEHMEQIARMCAEMGFDGFDINMGCPDCSIEKSGCGAALIKNPALARELIRAAKRGAGDIPVSIKTRIGYNKDELDPPAGGWLTELLAEEPAAVALHARTRKEMSDVPAHWERIKYAVKIRNSRQGEALPCRTLIIGNGDVRDLADARAKAAETGCDGVMLGRAVFGNPWLFASADNPEQGGGTDRTPQEKIRALMEHLELFEELMAETTNYAVMKKHFKAYISGWDGAKEMRARLMGTESAEEAREILKELVRNAE